MGKYIGATGLQYLWGKIKAALSGKQNLIQVVANGTTNTTATLVENTYYVWDTVESLSLSLAPPSDSTKYAKYMFEFVSGSVPTTLSLPATVVFANSLEVESGKRYQVSIVNNIATYIAVESNFVPYDYEVNYLRSTPDARIDTGIYDIDKFEIKFRVSSFTAYGSIFGNYIDENHNTWRLILGSSSGGNMLISMNTKASGGSTSVPIGTLSTDHTLVASLDSVTADGVEVSNISTTVGTANSTEIVLFAKNTGHTSIPNLYLRIYYFKAWKNNVLLRDFIPVVIGTTGYMYDRVNQRLYGNDGASGELIPGDRKYSLPTGYTQLTYISGSGNSYIDTGLKSNSRYTYEITYQKNDTVNSSAFFGMREGSAYNNGAIFGYSYASGTNSCGYYVNGNAVSGTNITNGANTSKHTYKVTAITGKHYFDNTESSIGNNVTTSEWVGQYNIFIFCWNMQGSPASATTNMKLFGYSVKDGNTLIQNLVPCKNSNNVVGLYDTVSETFYASPNGNTFTAGEVVS